MRSMRFALLALLLLSAASSGLAEPVRLRILHVNDFHGFAEPHQPLSEKAPLGGIAYLAARIRELSRERPTLVLAAGDMIQGSNWANLTQGASVVEAMNAVGFDAMVVGNHEFDFGQGALAQRIGEAHFPVLGANVQGLSALKPHAVFERGGARVAVVGVVTPETSTTTHPRNVTGLTFGQPEEAVAREHAELREKADLLIVLAHLGHPAERALAERVPGIGAVVGGHSHTRVARPAVVGHTVVVQAWEHGKALGVLDLAVDDGKVVGSEGRLVDIRPEPGGADPEVEGIVKKYVGQVEARLSEPVGVAAVPLDGEGVRLRETNLGNLVADVIRNTAAAEAAIVNSGGIRRSIPLGEIRTRDVYAALPFDSYVLSLRLTGRQLIEALEHGVSAVERGEGRFPQVSGLRFTYTRSAPPGSRVREVQIGGAPLDRDRIYTVATNDFLAAGGDGYRAFGEALRAAQGAQGGQAVAYNDTSRYLRDLVISAIREKGIIAPAAEDRIRELP